MAIIRKMREVCQQRKPNAKGEMVWAGHWINTLFVRHFSIYITWLFVRTGISANTTTFCLIPLSLVGVAMCVPHILGLNAMGIFLLMLAEVFDCVDGEIARWTKKSSLKGFYLDLVSHVLSDAPPFMICGLHLYILNGQLKYMILAFLAYVTAQWRLGLSKVYYRVKVESFSKKESEPSSIISIGSTLQGKPKRIKMMFCFAKWLAHTLKDRLVIQLISFVCIFLSYGSILNPMIFFAWFFVIIGIFGVIGDITSKFVFYVPHMKHIKKV